MLLFHLAQYSLFLDLDESPPVRFAQGEPEVLDALALLIAVG